MKVAVSIPDDVYEAAEALAREQNIPRSRLYSRALSAFVAKHAQAEVTDAMNAFIDEFGQEPDPFVQRAARQAFERLDR